MVITRTRRPVRAAASARDAEMVVFPTPPVPQTTTTLRSARALCSDNEGRVELIVASPQGERRARAVHRRPRSPLFWVTPERGDDY